MPFVRPPGHLEFLAFLSTGEIRVKHRAENSPLVAKFFAILSVREGASAGDDRLFAVRSTGRVMERPLRSY